MTEHHPVYTYMYRPSAPTLLWDTVYSQFELTYYVAWKMSRNDVVVHVIMFTPNLRLDLYLLNNPPPPPPPPPSFICTQNMYLLHTNSILLRGTVHMTCTHNYGKCLVIMYYYTRVCTSCITVHVHVCTCTVCNII